MSYMPTPCPLPGEQWIPSNGTEGSLILPPSEPLYADTEKEAPLQSVEARYKDLLNHLGVQGHDGAVAEISKLRKAIWPGDVPLSDLLERMRARADNAYCLYIGALRKDECLGWEIKVERGKFGKAEIEAHCKANEMLGRHRALHEAAEMLQEFLSSNAEVSRPGERSSNGSV